MSDKPGMVETTSMNNRVFRTHERRSNGCAADAFNDMGHVPAGPIDLGDGRELCICGWAPVSDLETSHERLDVTVTGFIRMKKGPTEVLGQSGMPNV